MINAELSHVTTLPEFYNEIRKQHEEAHGSEYCWQHDAMQKLMEHCDSYRELGSHQGASAAAACLTNPKSVTMIDINLDRWRPFEHIFQEYCDENGIKLNARELSSIDTKTAEPVDLLLIDSLHTPNHLVKEFAVHMQFVRKYVVLHDTEIINGRVDDSLYRVAENYCNQLNPWRIIERNRANVGYTVMENTLNV